MSDAYMDVLNQILVRLTAIEAVVGKNATPTTEGEPTLDAFVKVAQGADTTEMVAGDSWEGVKRACANVGWWGKQAVPNQNLAACWAEVYEIKAIPSQEDWYKSMYAECRPETVAWALLQGVVYPHVLTPLQAPKFSHIAGKTIAQVIDELIANKNAGSTGTGPGPGGY